MAVDLPANAQRLNVANFKTNTPIVSGAAAADKPYGFRGISSELNHAQAERIHTFATARDPENGTIADAVTAGAAWQTLAGPFESEMGAGVTTIQAVVDGLNIEIRMTANAVTSAGTVITGRATGTETLTLAASTGIDNLIELQWREKQAGAPQANPDCYGFTIQEVALVAGEIT